MNRTGKHYSFAMLSALLLAIFQVGCNGAEQSSDPQLSELSSETDLDGLSLKGASLDVVALSVVSCPRANAQRKVKEDEIVEPHEQSENSNSHSQSGSCSNSQDEESHGNASNSESNLDEDSKNNGNGQDKKDSDRKKNRVCVQICHRPPGNPENAKTMVLPLRSVFAHLGHGHHHLKGDHFGSCNLESNPDEGTEDSASGSSEEATGEVTEDSSVDNSSNSGAVDETSGGSSDSSQSDDIVFNGSDPVLDGEIPLWCQQLIEVDANCDGINDSTGVPLF